MRRAKRSRLPAARRLDSDGAQMQHG